MRGGATTRYETSDGVAMSGIEPDRAQAIMAIIFSRTIRVTNQRRSTALPTLADILNPRRSKQTDAQLPLHAKNVTASIDMERPLALPMLDSFLSDLTRHDRTATPTFINLTIPQMATTTIKGVAWAFHRDL